MDEPNNMHDNDVIDLTNSDDFTAESEIPVRKDGTSGTKGSLQVSESPFLNSSTSSVMDVGPESSSAFEEPLSPATDHSETSKSLSGSGRVTPVSQSDISITFSSSEKSTPVRRRKSIDAMGRQIEFDSMSSSSGSVRGMRLPQRLGISWRIGERLEAMDYMTKWFPAKIRSINEDELQVLIHFDGWNQRYDEWIDMTSERIRPLVRHSERKHKNRRVKADHKIGDAVYAKWTDCKMYPAKITAILPNGCYEVIFYDGFKKLVQSINIRSMPGERKAIEISPLTKPVLKKPKLTADMSEIQVIEGMEDVSLPSSQILEVSRKPCTPIEKARGRPPKLKKKTIISVPDVIISEKPLELPSNTGSISCTSQTQITSEPISTQTEYIEEKIDDFDDSTQDLILSTGIEVAPLPITSVNCMPVHTQAPLSATPLCSTPLLTVPMCSTPLCALTPVPPSKSVPPKAFIVDSDHNQFKCHVVGCNKSFRKEHLLDYHIKYYHLEEEVPQKKPTKKMKKTMSSGSAESESGNSKIRNVGKRNFIVVTDTQLGLPGVKSEVTEEITQADIKTGEMSIQTSPSKLTSTDIYGIDDSDLSLKSEVKIEPRIDDGVENSSITDAEDFLKPDELVNCICDYQEENGLMIQCEVCICWQHAACFGITERTLPKTYVCFVCENPPGVRESARYIHEQDWFQTGELATFNYLHVPPASEETCNTIKTTHSLVAELHQLNSVLHSLKMQLDILRTKDEAKLKMWRIDWDVMETPNLNMETFNIKNNFKQNDKTDVIVNYDDDDVIVREDKCALIYHQNGNDLKEKIDVCLKAEEDNVEEDKKPCNVNMDNFEDSKELKMEHNSDTTCNVPGKDEVNFQCNSGETLHTNSNHIKTSFNYSETKIPYQAHDTEMCDVDRPNITQEPMETSGIRDHLKEMVFPSTSKESETKEGYEQEDGSHSDSTESVVEDTIQVCEKNLLSHICRVEAEISDKLDKIEKQVLLLEALDATENRKEPLSPQNVLSDMPQLKRSLRYLHNDLYKVKKMSVFH